MLAYLRPVHHCLPGDGLEGERFGSRDRKAAATSADAEQTHTSDDPVQRLKAALVGRQR